MRERASKKTYTVICCLADRELSEWSARCFMAAGLNSIACCTLADLDRYANWVQADAVVLDAEVSDAPTWSKVWQRWALAGGVACLVEAATAAGWPEAPNVAASVRPDAPPDLVFSRPLNCDQMAYSLAGLLRKPAVPQDLRSEALSASATAALRLDHRWCQVQPLMPFGSGASVELTPQEYRLLYALLRHSPQVVSREALLSDLVKGGTGLETTRSVDQIVRRLREVLAQVHLESGLLTVRGEGYLWRDPVPPSAFDDAEG